MKKLFIVALLVLLLAACVPPTPTQTITPSVTVSPATETFTPTDTVSETPSSVPSATDTLTPTESPTTSTTFTPTPSQTLTPTASNTPSYTPTFTASLTNTSTYTNTPIPSATDTNTPSATATYTPTLTASLTNTSTYTNTPIPSATNTNTPSATATYTPTLTATPTFTASVTRTLTPTNTATRTNTSTVTPSPTPTRTATSTAVITPSASFRFISWGDAQDMNTNLANTASQASGLSPAFTIFNGDLEDDGVVTARMDAMTSALGSLYQKTFLVRGNHDNHVTGSAALWETYFSNANRSLPTGVTNYVALDSSSTYLTYSFDYSNSRFIGIDSPGDFGIMTSAEFTFLDARLTNAESIGLVHAFIFFHGPEYCVESVHCTVSTRTGPISTNMAKFVAIINKHPIVSATFHGHEHILGWVHMDNTRVSTINIPYEEFFTSPSGGSTYNTYIYPARIDYFYPTVPRQGFAGITVNGNTFTFNIYVSGQLAPVWARAFTKSSARAPTPTATPTKSPP